MVGLLLAVMMIGSMLVCSVSAAEVTDETQSIIEILEPAAEEEPIFPIEALEELGPPTEDGLPAAAIVEELPETEIFELDPVLIP